MSDLFDGFFDFGGNDHHHNNDDFFNQHNSDDFLNQMLLQQQQDDLLREQYDEMERQAAENIRRTEEVEENRRKLQQEEEEEAQRRQQQQEEEEEINKNNQQESETLEEESVVAESKNKEASTHSPQAAAKEEQKLTQEEIEKMWPVESSSQLALPAGKEQKLLPEGRKKRIPAPPSVEKTNRSFLAPAEGVKGGTEIISDGRIPPLPKKKIDIKETPKPVDFVEPKPSNKITEGAVETEVKKVEAVIEESFIKRHSLPLTIGGALLALAGGYALYEQSKQHKQAGKQDISK
jgi:hypothetical protein